MTKIRCNNCMNIYEEDEGNLIFIVECEKCKTDQYLTIIEGE